MSDKAGKESQYMVSHPELGSDLSIGSDRESGCDSSHHTLVTKKDSSLVLLQ